MQRGVADLTDFEVKRVKKKEFLTAVLSYFLKDSFYHNFHFFWTQALFQYFLMLQKVNNIENLEAPLFSCMDSFSGLLNIF